MCMCIYIYISCMCPPCLREGLLLAAVNASWPMIFWRRSLHYCVALVWVLRVPTSHQASGARAFLGTKPLPSPWPILCTLWVVEYISAVSHFAHTPCSVPDRRAQFYLPLLLCKHSTRNCVSWDVLKSHDTQALIYSELSLSCLGWLWTHSVA